MGPLGTDRALEDLKYSTEGPPAIAARLELGACLDAAAITWPKTISAGLLGA